MWLWYWWFFWKSQRRYLARKIIIVLFHPRIIKTNRWVCSVSWYANFSVLNEQVQCTRISYHFGIWRWQEQPFSLRGSSSRSSNRVICIGAAGNQCGSTWSDWAHWPSMNFYHWLIFEEQAKLWLLHNLTHLFCRMWWKRSVRQLPYVLWPSSLTSWTQRQREGTNILSFYYLLLRNSNGAPTGKC